MTKLNVTARETLREHGVTQAQFIRHHYGPDATTWGGDVCGCTDDRCANGYHHESVDDCRCLPVIIDMMRERA